MPPIKIVCFGPGVIGICAAHGKRLTFLRLMHIVLPIAAVQLSVGALYV